MAGFDTLWLILIIVTRHAVSSDESLEDIL